MRLNVTTDQLAYLLDGEVRGQTRQITGISFDSRTTSPGDVFIALTGELVDGHDFVAQALERGAVAALVEHWVSAAGTQVKVNNCLDSLREWGRSARQQSSAHFVGITGSAGKTTVKALLAHLLSTMGATAATQGNYNNEIGVPLTLLSVTPEDEFATVEMGARRRGDIAYLCSMVRPAIRILTAVMPAHIETFGSIETIAQTKGEIFDHMQASDLAIMPAESPYLDQWVARANGRIMTFGTSLAADMRIVSVNDLGFDGIKLTLSALGNEVTFQAPLLGVHNAGNIAAAALAACDLGLGLDAVAQRLASFEPVAGRMTPRLTPRGQKLIDDTYNANPEAMQQALYTLGLTAGRTLAILGPMAELGDTSSEYHRQVLDYALAAGINELWLCGDSWPSSEHSSVRYFTTPEHIMESLGDTREADLILIKASRSAGLDSLVTRLIDQSQEDAC